MLRITIELVPGGDENRAAIIDRGCISNVTDIGEVCDYVCSFEEDPWKGRSRGPMPGNSPSTGDFRGLYHMQRGLTVRLVNLKHSNARTQI